VDTKIDYFTIFLQVVYVTWDIDNIISLGSIVFCFSNWKQLILPWSCFGNRFKVLTSNSTSGTV